MNACITDVTVRMDVITFPEASRVSVTTATTCQGIISLVSVSSYCTYW